MPVHLAAVTADGASDDDQMVGGRGPVAIRRLPIET